MHKFHSRVSEQHLSQPSKFGSWKELGPGCQGLVSNPHSPGLLQATTQWLQLRCQQGTVPVSTGIGHEERSTQLQLFLLTSTLMVICTHMYTYIICTHMYTYMHTHLHLQSCAHMYTYSPMHTCTLIVLCTQYTLTVICTQCTLIAICTQYTLTDICTQCTLTDICTHAHLQTYEHNVHLQTYAHMYTYSHMHMCTQTVNLWNRQNYDLSFVHTLYT